MQLLQPARKASMLLLLLLPKYAGKTHAAEFMLLLLFVWKCGEQADRRLGSMRAAGVIGRGSERCGWMVIFRDAMCGGIVTREVF